MIEKMNYFVRKICQLKLAKKEKIPRKWDRNKNKVKTRRESCNQPLSYYTY